MTVPINTRLVAAMHEDELQAHLVKVARREGWLVYFTWNSRHSPAGWPDLICLRGSTMLALELKREGAAPTEKQEECLAALGLIDTVLVDVARPSNVKKIEELLTIGGRPWMKGER